MRGTTRVHNVRGLVVDISTHVPHAGHDRLALGRVILVCGISTHVPHAGHDGRDADKLRNAVDFNSRAPCGARHCDSDTVAPSNPFQLTCPMRGTTDDPPAARLVSDISTHVPHAGHDVIAELIGDTVDHFNSRAPCGARLIKEITQHILNGFQLTCPMRGTTNKFYNNIATVNISTHVPHAGHDCSYRRPSAFHFSFQLTCPMRGTTWSIEYRRGRSPISTHVPHAGHDCLDGRVLRKVRDFNSRAPCGARLPPTR